MMKIAFSPPDITEQEINEVLKKRLLDSVIPGKQSV